VKIVTELFDFVLLLVLLGLMLPFLFGATEPLVDMTSWGFYQADDKTMKMHGGDILSLDELYADDSMTAAEIMLMARVHNRETIQPSRYRLPNGTTIVVDGDYPIFMNENANRVRAALDPARRYRMDYDYDADLWQIR
jgi:hypothetical protein